MDDMVGEYLRNGRNRPANHPIRRVGALTFSQRSYVEDELFRQKWSQKRCSYWSEVTPCQIFKKCDNIFRGMTDQACLGTFFAKNTYFDRLTFAQKP